MPTKKIVTDDLIKVLLVIKHKKLVKMTSIEDQKEFLTFIKREDNLRDTFQ